MGVPTSEVGYIPAMPRRADHEVHKDMWWHWTKKKTCKICTAQNSKHEQETAVVHSVLYCKGKRVRETKHQAAMIWSKATQVVLTK